MLLYNTKEGKWSKTGEYPYPAQVTTTAVKWGNDIVVSNGEIKPGVRTPDVMIGSLPRSQGHTKMQEGKKK